MTDFTRCFFLNKIIRAILSVTPYQKEIFILLFIGQYSSGLYTFGSIHFWTVHFWIVQIWSCTDLPLYRLGLYRFKCTVLDYTNLAVEIGTDSGRS